MRYSMDGRQIKTSLQTPDETEAFRLANQIWHEQTYRLKQGLTIEEQPFSKVAEEFIKKVEFEASADERSKYHPIYWPPIIRRFPMAYFGDKPIDTITSADLERYLLWRKTYWTSGPGSKIEKIRCERNGRIYSRAAPRKVAALSTLNGEMVIIRGIFEQAARWGYCQPLVMPSTKTRKRVDNRRPSFTNAEYTALLRVCEKRMYESFTAERHIQAKDGRTWKLPPPNKHVRADRIRLYAYILLMGNTGLRPTEAKNLTWGNILLYRETRNKPDHEKDARLQVRGKGKHGVSVPLPSAIYALGILWDLFEEEIGREPNDDDPLFANHEGKRINSFKRGFAEALKAADLERDHRGVRRTPYSLRHYYISSRIEEGVPVHDIARNTRTSIAMIDKHYAQVSTEQIKDSLRRGYEDWYTEAKFDAAEQATDFKVAALTRKANKLRKEPSGRKGIEPAFDPAVPDEISPHAVGDDEHGGFAEAVEGDFR